MQFVCRWVQNKISGSISKKKIQPKFKQSGKTLPNHNSVFAEHTSNLGPEKKTWSRYQVTNNGLRAQKKARKHEITTFWIEKCQKCLRCPGTQTSQNLVGKIFQSKS